MPPFSHKSAARDKRQPFYLGFEGERWVEALSGLVIPVPGSKLSVVVQHWGPGKKYHVILKSEWAQFEDLLLAVAHVHEIITTKGN